MEDVRIEHRYNASDFKLGNHHENVYQMLLITNGRIRYRVGSKTYETGRGGILVLNTLEEHDLEGWNTRMNATWSVFSRTFSRMR